MFQAYRRFIRGVSVNNWGKTGVVLTTSSFATFIVLEVARLVGILTNAYMGLVTYLSLPTLFVIGLVLIPVGWIKYKKSRGKSTRELLREQFPEKETTRGFFGSRLVRTILLFTVINVLFLSLASLQTLQFMDNPEFCGTACHSVMNPEWTTYQDSPHARVACVDCHVGEGVDALIASKLNGAYQMISVTFDLLERPIPTPVHQLRPARETCEKCHWPDKFYGSRLQTDVIYDRDSASSALYTTLGLKIDAGRAGYKAGIHWHIAEENEVRYTSINDEREEMIWVDVLQPDSTFKRYTNTLIEEPETESDVVRTFDCVDCHNRATHIYELPGEAVDERIRRGLIDRTLPYIKREAVSAITINYPDSIAAMEGIANSLHGFYRRIYPNQAAAWLNRIDSAVNVLQAVYNRNIHHEMNITWGVYESHIGHRGNLQGCFRCHNPYLVDNEGNSIEDDCTMCHSILSNKTDDPFKALKPLDTTDVEFLEYRALREEFLEFFIE